MYVIQMRSGVVDAFVEGALILLTVLLCAGTLDRIRGLSLEHKLRRGKVIALDRRSLTLPETAASALVVIGLPIAALLTSIGRNGASAPLYTPAAGLTDVWDPNLTGPLFPFNKAKDSVLMCGTAAADLTPQAATVDGKGYCPASFRLPDSIATRGFVSPDSVEEVPPLGLFPAGPQLNSWGAWRSQCNVTEEAGPRCFTWKWTRTNFTVCPPTDPPTDERDTAPAMCGTFKLASGAPEIDTDKAGGKVGRGWKSGRGTQLLIAHFTVTKPEVVELELLSDQKQITEIDTMSAAGLVSVLVVTVVAWLCTWLAALWARRKWGYDMRLHTYSGLAAYAASLEDRYCTAAKEAMGSGECEAIDSYHEPDAERVAEKRHKKQRPHIRLMEGRGTCAGLVSIGQNPAGSEIKVRSGRLATGIASFDGMPSEEDPDESFNSQPLSV